MAVPDFQEMDWADKDDENISSKNRNMRIEEKLFAMRLIHDLESDSLSYLALENDKQIFWGQKGQGLIAYVVIGKIAVCLGNPVCDKSDLFELISEFKQYCKGNRLKLCFSSISKEIAGILCSMGFLYIKYGEEALIHLPSYEISGAKKLKLRQKFRQVEKSGIRVTEYYPGIRRDPHIEAQIEKVSNEWFSSKKGKLTFSLGDLHLEEPLGRRYFVSMDQSNQVHTILMFSPFFKEQGYYLDVMRRRISDTCPGTMEHAIITAAMKMKAEGVNVMSLGIAPLAGLNKSRDSSTPLERFMNFMYYHVKSEYSFETLYQFKKKFAPDEWRSRYIAFEQTIPSYKVGYVMIKARNGKRLSRQLVKGIFNYWGNSLRHSKASIKKKVGL